MGVTKYFNLVSQKAPKTQVHLGLRTINDKILTEKSGKLLRDLPIPATTECPRTTMIFVTVMLVY